MVDDEFNDIDLNRNDSNLPWAEKTAIRGEEPTTLALVKIWEDAIKIQIHQPGDPTAFQMEIKFLAFVILFH